jgi:predicted DCC family thiol-disulfide oxidoreductase YuxK
VFVRDNIFFIQHAEFQKYKKKIRACIPNGRPMVRYLRSARHLLLLRKNCQYPEMEIQRKEPDHILFFDGFCLLCEGVVYFILKRDKKGLLHFSALHSKYFSRISGNLPGGGSETDSVVLLSGGRIYQKSQAAFLVAGLLGFPWSFLGIFGILPRSFTDMMYDFIARNRYRWFGRKKTCFVPKPDWKARFLEDLPDDNEKTDGNN